MLTVSQSVASKPLRLVLSEELVQPSVAPIVPLSGHRSIRELLRHIIETGINPF